MVYVLLRQWYDNSDDWLFYSREYFVLDKQLQNHGSIGWEQKKFRIPGESGLARARPIFILRFHEVINNVCD